MSASNTDKFKKLTNNFSTTLSAAIVGAGDNSMSLTATTNLPTDTGTVYVIDRVNASGTLTPTVREYVKGTVSGSSVTNLVRGLGGSTAQAHSIGAVVEQVVDQNTINDLMDGILFQHNQDGTHGAITSTGATLTTPKVVTSINDTNNNELIRASATSSAVNDVTVTNATTGNAPGISASGDDTNIHLLAIGKGNGLTKISVLRQDDTTNTYKHNSVILSGWGTGVPGAANALQETVTFGITFAQRPIVVATFGGDNISGTLTYGAGAVQRNNAWAEAHTITTTTFGARVASAGNWTAGDSVFYQWIAIGEL